MTARGTNSPSLACTAGLEFALINVKGNEEEGPHGESRLVSTTTPRSRRKKKKGRMRIPRIKGCGCRGRGGSALHTSGLCRPRGDTADNGSSRRVTRRCTSHRVKKKSLAARDTKRDDGSGTSKHAASVSLRELANAQWDPQGLLFFFQRSGSCLVPSKQTVASPGFQGD